MKNLALFTLLIIFGTFIFSSCNKEDNDVLAPETNKITYFVCFTYTDNNITKTLCKWLFGEFKNSGLFSAKHSNGCTDIVIEPEYCKEGGIIFNIDDNPANADNLNHYGVNIFKGDSLLFFKKGEYKVSQSVKL